jgi:hypothetical protein
MYRCTATSVSGFVQQLAVSFLVHRYWFYVAGHVPARKDPACVDQKLLERYGIAASRWAKARGRKAGQASLQYLRHGRFFLLLATHGHHEFFNAERAVLRDARRRPITFAGYAVSYRGGHPHVRIERQEYRMLKEHFGKLALRRRPEELARELSALPFEPYAPVRRQLLVLLRLVNRMRKTAGLGPVETDCLRLRRRIQKPFAEGGPAADWRVDAYLTRFATWRPAAGASAERRGRPRKACLNSPGLC